MDNKPKRFLSRAILATLYVVGDMTMKSFFAHPYCHYFCKHYKQMSIYSSLYKLRRQKLIRKIGSNSFQLTREGKHEAIWASAETHKYLPREKNNWDGKWRVLIFDIPEKKRSKRDDFRDVLDSFGFKELQKSVWITPYKIPRIIDDILWEEKLIGYTRVMTISEIDYDEDLKKHFGLM